MTASGDRQPPGPGEATAGASGRPPASLSTDLQGTSPRRPLPSHAEAEFFQVLKDRQIPCRPEANWTTVFQTIWTLCEAADRAVRKTKSLDQARRARRLVALIELLRFRLVAAPLGFPPLSLMRQVGFLGADANPSEAQDRWFRRQVLEPVAGLFPVVQHPVLKFNDQPLALYVYVHKKQRYGMKAHRPSPEFFRLLEGLPAYHGSVTERYKLYYWGPHNPGDRGEFERDLRMPSWMLAERPDAHAAQALPSAAGRSAVDGGEACHPFLVGGRVALVAPPDPDHSLPYEERFEAFCHFLVDHPAHHRQAVKEHLRRLGYAGGSTPRDLRQWIRERETHPALLDVYDLDGGDASRP